MRTAIIVVCIILLLVVGIVGGFYLYGQPLPFEIGAQQTEDEMDEEAASEEAATDSEDGDAASATDAADADSEEQMAEATVEEAPEETQLTTEQCVQIYGDYYSDAGLQSQLQYIAYDSNGNITNTEEMGVVSVSVADLNDDGTLEMLLVQVSGENQAGLCMEIYGIEDGAAALQASLEDLYPEALEASSGRRTDVVQVGESILVAIYGDGVAVAYLYQLDENALELVWSAQTGDEWAESELEELTNSWCADVLADYLSTAGSKYDDVDYGNGELLCSFIGSGVGSQSKTEQGITNVYDYTGTLDNAEVNEFDFPAGTVEYNGHHYMVCLETTDWESAELACEEMGGHLVTIANAEENDYVYTLACAYSTELAFLTGGTDHRQEGTFEWITGEPFEYTCWGYLNEPDNYRGYKEQDYITLLTFDQSGEYKDDSGESWGIHASEWDDKDGGDNPYICEWDF